MKYIYSFIILNVFFFIGVSAQPGALDLSFDPGTGSGSSVYCSAVQSDGKILIGGQFTSYNGTTINRIARLNSDGTLDGTFNPGSGADNTVYSISIQSDGKIIIGGDFTTVNGTGRVRVARLNDDGSLDATFTVGSGASGIVYTTAIQTDGKIIIGGNFSGFNGTTRYFIARLNSDGSLDTGFNSGTAANSYVQSVSIQSDGKIVLGGNFTFFAGGSINYIARVNSDGTNDTGFDPGSGTNAIVYSTALQTNGKILVGGNFTSLNGGTANYITRLNSNGSVDNTFSSGTGANASVRCISLQADGQIIIGGTFTSYNGVTQNRIAALNTNGTRATEFSSGTAANNVVLTTSIQTGREIIIGGVFTSYNGTGRNRIARINNQTISTDVFGPATYCEGTNLNISFTIAGVFNSGNIFTAQLSDETGSFASPVAIGSFASTVTGNISATIPTSLPSGSAYRIRVVSDNPIVNGNDNGNDISINMLAAPTICLVTVDTQSTHNIIIWEKPITTQIDSFFIYRETTLNNYTKIATVAYDSLNEYHDFGADPNVTSWKYKVSALDTCGFESAKSDFHSTIHLQNLGGGNLQWTLYQIENAGNPVTFYQIYRDDFNTMNFSALSTSIPGGNSTYTDPAFSSFPNANYVVDVNWSISCTPFRTSINTTRSNLWIGPPIIIGLNEELEKQVWVYPVPASENIIIEFTEPVKIKRLKIVNNLGQTIYEEGKSVTAKKQINVQAFAKGIYILDLESEEGIIKKKIVVQ